jgi:hypothetical protein
MSVTGLSRSATVTFLGNRFRAGAEFERLVVGRIQVRSTASGTTGQETDQEYFSRRAHWGLQIALTSALVARSKNI